ncbi:ethanolamine catabolic microcompartment shell protein [Gammaproteobacteria bacterium]|nr:ethanolamine catabolic microcompartment shell protein [Gammaproteobacteria bacterium]
MKLAIVLGQVVATVKHHSLTQERLLVIDFIDEYGKRLNTTAVATDTLGAGVDEIVLVVQGSSARASLTQNAPVDMSVVGIVDEVVINHKVTFHK